MPNVVFMQRLKLKNRVLLSAFTIVLVAILIPTWVEGFTRVLGIWDAGMICFLTLTWVVMFRATPELMQRYAKVEDEGRIFILSTITAAAFASLLAIVFLLKESKGVAPTILLLHLILAIVTIVGSWLLVHTIFALHYAHSYYKAGKTLSECKDQGLDFPNEIEPDYWDFLYFSFVKFLMSKLIHVRSGNLRYSMVYSHSFLIQHWLHSASILSLDYFE
jgi:uncharacterized membrane protein